MRAGHTHSALEGYFYHTELLVIFSTGKVNLSNERQAIGSHQPTAELIIINISVWSVAPKQNR